MLVIPAIAIAGLFLTPAAHAASGGAKGKATLAVSVDTPAEGQNLRGSVTWSVSVSGGTPIRVDFAVDGIVRWSQATSPFRYGGKTEGLDTTALPDGAHVLTATAYGAKGLQPGSATVRVQVSNAPPPDPPPLAERAYWGAWIGTQLTGGAPPWDLNALSIFEQLAGKPVSLLHFGVPFANCASSPCSFYTFPWTPFNNIRAHGAIPFLSWASQSIPSTPSEPDFQLADVIAGTYDGYISSFARRAAEWKHPFFLRFNWEMNGGWFPWGIGANGNQTSEYAVAWRRVHDLFVAAGATNATWVWCPNFESSASLATLSALYPGDAYVDWTCLDGYNWGASPIKPDKWRSFVEQFGSSYAQITGQIAPSKPMVIGETASTEYGGSKASWIAEMFEALPTRFPKVRGLLWFEKTDSGMDWPIESSPTATQSFAQGIGSDRYAGNEFGGLSGSPIPPP